MDAKLSRVISFKRVNDGASETKIDPHGGANKTVQHLADAGEDSYPLPNDYLLFSSFDQQGGGIGHGYIDPKNQQKAAAGEKRTYARNSGGSQVVEFWMKKDGEAIIENLNGHFIKLEPTGKASIHNDIADIIMFVDGEIIAKNANGSINIKPDGKIITQNTTAKTTHEVSGEVKNENPSGYIKLQADGEVNINGLRITTAGDVVTSTGVSLTNHPHSQPADSDGDTQANTNAPTATG